jgi:disulfide bond formation protein DsbB
MSDGLNLPAHYYDTPGDQRSRALVPLLLRAVAMLAVFAGAGVGAGYAWRHLWTPPTGEAVEGSWVPVPLEAGLANDFSGVGWYVVVAVVTGLLLGLVTALVMRRAEIAGVAVAVLGSALAAYLVLATGERLSPPDPDTVAATSDDGTEIPGDLEFDGWTPLLSLPVGTLASLGTIFMLTDRRRSADARGDAAYATVPYPPNG